MASFDSANGPSATLRPFFPETSLPLFFKGWPPEQRPSCFSRSNQAYQSVTPFWICSGERPLSQFVPRNSSMYSDVLFVALIGLLFRSEERRVGKECRSR